MTIEEFIEARLAEDEVLALAASPGPWHPNAEHDEVIAVDDIEVCTGFALSGNQLRATVDHIVCHDPARMLRQGAALRAIVDGHRKAVAAQATGSISKRTRDLDEGFAEMSAFAIASIAAIWADHPAYRPEWSVA